jgi:hypothetical protein
MIISTTKGTTMTPGEKLKRLNEILNEIEEMYPDGEAELILSDTITIKVRFK